MGRRNRTHTTRAARAVQARTGLPYNEALARVRAAAGSSPRSGPEAPQERHEPAPTRHGCYRVDYVVSTAMDTPPTVVHRGTTELAAPDASSAVAAAIDWVHDNDPYCDPRIDPLVDVEMVREVRFYVESGNGQALSEYLDETSARREALRREERLVGVLLDEDGERVEDWLEWDYGAEPGSDDEQASRDTRTDLCGACRPVDHVTCSMDPSCACCRETIAALVEE